MSTLKAIGALNILYILVTPEVSHAPMSSLKDERAFQLAHLHVQSMLGRCPQNKYDMSVTTDVSHVEIWPYVAAAAPRIRDATPQLPT